MSAVLRAFLFAYPAAHSLSPALHRAALASVGWTGDYRAEAVAPAELAARLQQFREAAARSAPGEYFGANLSLPHKEAALPLLDSLTPQAQAIGAVNTLVWRAGQLVGDNTDAGGLQRALSGEEGYRPVPGRPAVVLGAGGAARAALWVLREWRQPAYVVNRTPARAEALAQDWNRAAPEGWRVQATAAADVPWAEVGLVLQASAAGLDDPAGSPLPDRGPADWARLPADALVYDMVYRPALTRLRREAEAAGRRTAGGLGMLTHQAALAFRAWTGEEPDVAAMHRAARLALAAGGAA